MKMKGAVIIHVKFRGARKLMILIHVKFRGARKLIILIHVKFRGARKLIILRCFIILYMSKYCLVLKIGIFKI